MHIHTQDNPWVITDVHILGSCLFAFQHTHSMGIKRHLNSHSDKSSKLIETCNRLGRKGEGKGLGGKMEPCHSSLHGFGAGEKRKPRAAHAPEQSPLFPTLLPRLHTPGRISMGLLVRTPQASFTVVSPVLSLLGSHCPP